MLDYLHCSTTSGLNGSWYIYTLPTIDSGRDGLPIGDNRPMLDLVSMSLIFGLLFGVSSDGA